MVDENLEFGPEVSVNAHKLAGLPFRSTLPGASALALFIGTIAFGGA